MCRSLPTRSEPQEPVTPTSATNTCIGALWDIFPCRCLAATSTVAPSPLASMVREGHRTPSPYPTCTNGCPETQMTDNHTLYATIVHEVAK